MTGIRTFLAVTAATGLALASTPALAQDASPAASPAGEPMSVEATREVIERYIASNHSDLSAMAPDVVFRVMATGQEATGPEGVAALLEYFYHVAFDAQAEPRNLVVGEGVAALEADFVGKHIGEFAGVAPTGKDVRVPLVVVYDLRDGQVIEARIYFEVPAFLAQVAPAAEPSAEPAA